jgi:peptidoglycan/LPS O-acetylase OafA/YrhL
MQSSEKEISGYAHQKPKRNAGEKVGFRPDIEGLRGIAVAMVVLFHAGLLSQASTQLTGGFIGVDLFFVVSGFLITGLLIRERESKGKISFSRFYARRVRRILPAAAVVLLITIPLANILVTLVDRSSVMEDGASAALSVANIRFAMTTDYFNPVSYSPFLHFWSLGVEEQFYFVWPAVLAIVAWKFPRAGAAAALTVIAVASFVASVIITNTSPSTAFYMLPTRAWQLASGGLLAIGAGSTNWLPGAIRRVFGQILALSGWAALAALITAAFVIDSTTTLYPGVVAIVPTIAGVLLIASGMEKTGPGILLRLPPVRFLGKISYSLYLWHWPMLILGGLYLNGQLWQPLSQGQALGLAALSIPVATASWLLVEEPFRRGFIPLPRPSRVVALGVGVMMIVAIIGTTFDFGAQSALASLNGPTDSPAPSPTASEIAVATPTPSPSVPTPTLPPNATPSPTPQYTPALSPTPVPGTPSSYAVTSALSPSLGRAATDYEAPWKAGCLGFSSATNPPTKCVYGNTGGSFTVALVGDSHASALFPGVNGVAKAHGWKLTTYLKIDCPFLDMPLDIAIPLPRVPYPSCTTWNAAVISRLQKTPPNLVIVSMSRWIYPVNGRSDVVSTDIAALTREIQKLPSSTKVVIIQDPPLPTNEKVPDCLSANQTDWRKCSFTRSRGFGSAMGSREKGAAAATGAGLIDLTSAICPGTGNCPPIINNMIVWRDEHHLTATFSATLAPAIDAQLVAILNNWAAQSSSPSP